MATKKQTKSAAPRAPIEKAQDARAAAKVAKDEASKSDLFVYSGNLPEGAKKLAPQAQTIVNTIQAAGKGGINRVDLVAGLKGVLTTRQPEGRILSYYQKALIVGGHVKMIPTKVTSKATDDDSDPEASSD